MHELNLSVYGRNVVAGSCEHDNEPSSYIRLLGIYWLSDDYRLKKDCAPLRQSVN